jgi:hypothetical protein
MKPGDLLKLSSHLNSYLNSYGASSNLYSREGDEWRWGREMNPDEKGFFISASKVPIKFAGQEDEIYAQIILADGVWWIRKGDLVVIT